MDWKEIIRVGMEMMKAGCNQNDNVDDCPKCPFAYYCFNTTVDNKAVCPETFFEEEDA